MSDITTRDSITSITQVQKAAALKKRPSLRKDEAEFHNRHGSLSWQDDSQITRCSLCSSKFTLTNRKHHCRECGKVFCGKCTSYNVVINATFKRACEQCYKEATKRSLNDSSVVFKNSEVPVMYSRADSIGRASDVSEFTKSTTPITASNSSMTSTSNASSLLSALTPSTTTPSATEQSLPSWVEGIVFIRKYFSENEPSIKVCGPKDHKFSAQMLEDIYATSLPLAQRGGSSDRSNGENKEQKFLFRIRDKSLPGAVFKDENDEVIGTAVNKSTIFYNCYVFYKQQTTPPAELLNQSKANGNSPSNRANYDRYTYRQAIVLISKWPLPQLAYRLLEKLDEALYFHAATTREERAHSDESVESVLKPSIAAEGWKDYDLVKDKPSPFLEENSIAAVDSEGGGAEITESVVKAVFTIALGQIELWPVPGPGIIVYLSFFGEMIHHAMPVSAEIFSTSLVGGNISFHIGLSSINIISLFGPLGLVQHLWTIWELLVTGQDIVIIAATPAQASEIVLGVASIVLPYAQLGDIRPYISGDDSDIDVLAATAMLKRSLLESGNATIQDTANKIAAKNKSMIVGICDPTILNRLEDFAAAIFIAPVRNNATNSLTDSDLIFKGMRSKNAADFHLLKPSNKGPSNQIRGSQTGGLSVPAKASRKKSILASTLSLTSSSISSSGRNESYGVAFQYWMDKDNMKRSAIIARQEPTAFVIARIVSKIKKLDPDDRAILGDQLFRDHFREITLGFFAPSVGGNIVTAEGRLSSAELDELKKDIELDKRNQHLLKTAESKGMVALALAEFLTYLQVSPTSLTRDIPTVIMWIGYLFILVTLAIFGVPALFIVFGFFLIKLPEKAPLGFELFLRAIIPSFILYPNSAKEENNVPNNISTIKKTSSTTSNSTITSTETQTKDFKPFNLSGVWKRVKLENYENVLAAQGATYVQRKLATSITMIHTITMDDDCTVIRLQEKGGPIETNHEYIIGADPVETKVMKNIFLDTVEWKDGKLTITKLRLPEKNYELILQRSLINQGKTIKLEARYHDLKGGKDVDSICYFDYIGPSSEPLPVTVRKSDNNKAEKGESIGKIVPSPAKKVIRNKRPDFSGVWQRTKTHNFEAYVGAAGAGFMQRKIAASMQLTHTITMDPPALQAFRLQEKGGPLNTDTTLTIGADFTDLDLNGKKFIQKMYWINDTLVMQRRTTDGSFELIMTRTLDLESNLETPQIILKLTHRDLVTKKETDAMAWFSKTGNTPNPPPVPDLASIVEIDEETGENDETSGAALAEDVAEEEVDNDEDDDDVAVAKMRTISTAKKSAFQSKIDKKSSSNTRKSFFSTSLFTSSSARKKKQEKKAAALAALKEEEDGCILEEDGCKLEEEEEDEERRSPLGLKDLVSSSFNGTWTQTALNNGDQSSSSTTVTTSQMTVTQIISVRGSVLSFQELSSSGTVLEDLKLTIDSSEFVSSQYLKKALKVRAYFEGNVLVMHRVFPSEKYEIYQRREVEENGNLIRLTTIRTNAVSGIESESMTLFRKKQE